MGRFNREEVLLKELQCNYINVYAMGVPRGETKVNKREEKCCKCSKYWNEMKAFLRCMGNTSEIIFEGK